MLKMKLKKLSKYETNISKLNYVKLTVLLNTVYFWNTTIKSEIISGTTYE